MLAPIRLSTLGLMVGLRIFPLGDVRAAEQLSAESRQSTTTPEGLFFSLGERGLNSLSFNGETLLRSPASGDLQLAKSPLRAVADAILPTTSMPEATLNRETQTVKVTYPWGSVSCTYQQKANVLGMRLEISNNGSEAIPALSLRLMQLDFPSIPQGNTLEAGMFGFGFEGKTLPLYLYPLIANPRFVAPVVRVDFGKSTLNFCSDDLACAISIPYTTNPLARTRYPFVINCPAIEPGATKGVHVSLRFGPAGADVKNLSGDVLQNYAKAYPAQLRWDDRRPIGAIFLAGSGKKVASNPRRWIMNAGDTDVVTEHGRTKFREALLRLADNSIGILKETAAQGMITWDPEGQEFSSACYYGDPRLMPVLAPETEFQGEGTMSAIDEYFAKFRAAGLRVGVCIRPQQIVMENGKPKQTAADDEHAARVLKDKIAYAKERWGCTLFYIDSSTTPSGPLNPDVIKNVADAFPDVLLIPENESLRYFAYSAPLNSYLHHKITRTPVGARTVYPDAFSILLTQDGGRAEDREAIAAAVRTGDIIVFNCWYQHPGLSTIKELAQKVRTGGH